MSGTPSSPAAVPKSKRPSENEFMQQRLPAWQPILTPRWVVATFLLIGIPFVILGFVLKAASDGVRRGVLSRVGTLAQSMPDLCSR